MASKADFDVSYVATLARLRLDRAEAELFQKQLGNVLQWVDKLKEVNLAGLEVSAHGTPLFNVLRSDEPREWFTQEQALSNAPQQANGLFIVTKVVE